MKVRLLPMAQADLIEIEAFIAQHNPTRAVTFIQEIIDVAHSLKTYPERFPLLPDYGDNVRRVVHGNYLIFYRYLGADPASAEVQILAVRHGARQPIVFDADSDHAGSP